MQISPSTARKFLGRQNPSQGRISWHEAYFLLHLGGSGYPPYIGMGGHYVCAIRVSQQLVDRTERFGSALRNWPQSEKFRYLIRTGLGILRVSRALFGLESAAEQHSILSLKFNITVPDALYEEIFHRAGEYGMKPQQFIRALIALSLSWYERLISYRKIPPGGILKEEEFVKKVSERIRTPMIQ